MKFQYINQPPNEFDYHVARADISTNATTVRLVAYGETVAEAEGALFAALDPEADLRDMGSV